ncbi:MAG TPA: sugar phosphate isomerase/epimerase family protein [Sedimentisphaerales bacterium]|nr:sugar phosphate isomerase/epimerase family protein [Sedimentisphaerales bacterium]
MASDRLNRRDFIARAAMLGTGVVLANTGSVEAGKKQKARLSTPRAQKIGWRVACQLYTFRDRSFYEALDVISSLGIRYVEPCYFLSLDKSRPDLKTSESLSQDVRRELKKRLDNHGVKMINYYAPIDGNTENFRKIFDFGKEMGVQTLVAEPPAEVFDKLEELCDEYKMNLAIHNHPQSPESNYWDPENVLKVCEGRGKRIGSCSDTGHWVRSGLDPIECLKKAKERIIALHLKDVIESGKPEARDVPLGTGKANYTAVLEELYAWKFRGVMTIEYEHLSDQLVQDVAQCIKFVEDFAASAKGR